MKTWLLILTSTITMVLVAVFVWSRVRHSQGSKVPASDAAIEKTQTINPSDLLFSLPTLCDGLPPLSSPVETVPGDAVQLDEDDWRQVEFVSSVDSKSVNRELAELREFKVANQAGPGWKNVYVRSSRPEAVHASKVELSRILELAHSSAPPLRLFLRTMGKTAEVRGGFAIPVGERTVLYGHTVDGIAVSLNLHASAKGLEASAVKSLISGISRTFDLVVVDWYRAEVLASR